MEIWKYVKNKLSFENFDNNNNHNLLLIYFIVFS